MVIKTNKKHTSSCFAGVEKIKQYFLFLKFNFKSIKQLLLVHFNVCQNNYNRSMLNAFSFVR